MPNFKSYCDDCGDQISPFAEMNLCRKCEARQIAEDNDDYDDSLESSDWD